MPRKAIIVLLAGMASGAAWLTLCITLSELLRRRVP